MTSNEKVARGFATKTHASRGISPDEMLARVLHRDGLMLIVDKPPGLSVHRGPKGGPSLEDYFDALRYGLPRPPALAHRLHKDNPGGPGLGAGPTLRKVRSTSRSDGSTTRSAGG